MTSSFGAPRIPAGGRPPTGYGAADVERYVSEPRKSASLPGSGYAAGRNEFARDRARVLHSGALRRLAGKTQVVGPNEDAVPRTRLTHSLEVAQIARGIGEHLGADADLVDLAGLAHDIGHPPFGHNGEAALDAACAAIGGFEANAQNLRLLTRLEPKVVDRAGRCHGLNLTRAALDAVIKYPWRRPVGGGKFGCYADDAEIFAWVRDPARGGPGGAPVTSVESQVMDWADDVAYSVHDVEDGVSAGRIDLALLARDGDERAEVARAAADGYSSESADDLAEILRELLALPAIRAGLSCDRGIAGSAALKQLTSELTGRFVTGAIAATAERHDGAAVRRYDGALVVPRLLAAEVAVLKAIAFHYVMQDPRHRAEKQRQQELLTELLAVIADGRTALLDPVLADHYRVAADDDARLRVAVDQVSLLTDAQAIAWHRRLVDGAPRGGRTGASTA